MPPLHISLHRSVPVIKLNFKKFQPNLSWMFLSMFPFPFTLKIIKIIFYKYYEKSQLFILGVQIN